MNQYRKFPMKLNNFISYKKKEKLDHKSSIKKLITFSSSTEALKAGGAQEGRSRYIV